MSSVLQVVYVLVVTAGIISVLWLLDRPRGIRNRINCMVTHQPRKQLKQVREELALRTSQRDALETRNQALVDGNNDYRNKVYSEAWAATQEQLERERSRVASLQKQANRLPQSHKDVRLVVTSVGTFMIRMARGYFNNCGVFVYFPQGLGFRTDIATAFAEAMDNRWLMDPAPGCSSGGDSSADAIITAGLDYQAHLRGEQGYFKDGSVPDLDEIKRILEQVIVHPAGVVAQKAESVVW